MIKFIIQVIKAIIVFSLSAEIEDLFHLKSTGIDHFVIFMILWFIISEFFEIFNRIFKRYFLKL